MNKLIYITCIFSVSLISVNAQEEINERFLQEYVEPSDSTETFDLALLFKSTSDGVIIRWAPTNPSAWLKGNEYGYTIEKLVLDSLNPREFQKVRPSPFTPWPLEAWESIVEDSNPYRAAAAMTIYGESEVGEGIVRQAEELENRHGMAMLSADLDALAAEASGLRYKDQEVELGDAIIYRIYVNTPSEVEAVDTVYDIYVHTELINLRVPPLEEASEGDRTITLQWLRPKGGMAFSGYYIERSEDGINFERLNNAPYLDITTEATIDLDYISYRDSIDQNGFVYQYRIRGIDAFADLSEPSNIIEAQGQDKVAPTSPKNLEVIEEELGTLTLYWEYTGETTADLSGYNVYKAIDINESFVKITETPLPAFQLKYIDLDPDERATNYYYVTAVDNNGNESSSNVAFGFTKDEVPPQPPHSLTGNIDRNGMLLLQWEAPSDEDIRGYQVFYSNSLSTTFGVKPGEYLPNTHFVDSLTLQTLSEDIYYYVIAIDWSYNQSEPSEILQVKKPDIIPPDPSIFTNYKVSEEGIFMEWKASTSADVTDIILKRKVADGPYETVIEFDPSNSSYLDQNVDEGVVYEYKLITIDDDGLETECEKHLVLEGLKSFFLDDITSFSVKSAEKGNELSWSYENLVEHEFIIYRSDIGGDLVTLKKLSAISSYIDTSADSSKKYTYAIKAKARDGRESQMNKVDMD